MHSYPKHKMSNESEKKLLFDINELAFNANEPQHEKRMDYKSGTDQLAHLCSLNNVCLRVCLGSDWWGE